VQKVFSAELFTSSEVWPLRPLRAIAFLLLVEWLQRHKQHGLAEPGIKVHWRWVLYPTLIVMCLAFFSLNAEFIYFQF
jgi:hypothetical protein